MAKQKKKRELTPEEIEYKFLKLEGIIEHCEKLGDEAIDWLQDYALTRVPVFYEDIVDENGDPVPVLDENGDQEMRDRTFIEIKLAFCDKYRPEIAPKRKSKDKGPSMYAKIRNLKKKENG